MTLHCKTWLVKIRSENHVEKIKIPPQEHSNQGTPRPLLHLQKTRPNPRQTDRHRWATLVSGQTQRHWRSSPTPNNPCVCSIFAPLRGGGGGTQSPSCGCKKVCLPFIFINGGVYPKIQGNAFFDTALQDLVSQNKE